MATDDEIIDSLFGNEPMKRKEAQASKDSGMEIGEGPLQVPNVSQAAEKITDELYGKKKTLKYEDNTGWGTPGVEVKSERRPRESRGLEGVATRQERKNKEADETVAGFDFRNPPPGKDEPPLRYKIDYKLDEPRQERPPYNDSQRGYNQNVSWRKEGVSEQDVQKAVAAYNKTHGVGKVAEQLGELYGKSTSDWKKYMAPGLGIESPEDKIRRIHTEADGTLSEEGQEALRSYKKAKQMRDTNKAMQHKDLGDLMTAKGMLGWVGDRKTEWDALAIGGTPQDTIEYEMVDVGTEEKPHWIKQAKFKKAMIGVPVKTKDGWTVYNYPATPDMVRLAIDRRKQMRAETSKKEADTGHKIAETSNLRSLMSNRERDTNLAEARVQAARSGRVKFGSTNFGREPIYMVTNEMGSTRDKYTLGGGGGIIAPTVIEGLKRNRHGMSNMSQRALSGNAAPMTINPLMRVGLPDVVGNRIQLDQRYVSGPQIPRGVTMLKLGRSDTGNTYVGAGGGILGGDGILEKLSAFKKKPKW